MTNFYIGQKVVCVEANFDCDDDEIIPEQGGIYTIRAIELSEDPADADGVFLRLVEIVNAEFMYPCSFGEMAFWSHAFRPVAEKPDALGVFRKMCRDAEAGKLVDA